jgi:hypothetical protein
VTKINPQRIYGNFVWGVALDVHTLSRTYLGLNESGHEVYDTARSEVGELLYRLKYPSVVALHKQKRRRSGLLRYAIRQYRIYSDNAAPAKIGPER